MFSSRKRYIIFVLSFAAIAALIVFAFRHWRRSRAPVPAEHIASAVLNNVSNIPQKSDAQELQTTPRPAYQGESVATVIEGNMGGGFPESYKTALRSELVVLAKKVASGEADFDDWMRIGVIKKVFRDFAGARDAWEYAGAVYTINPLPFYNLGDLYGWYMKDFQKSEASFKRAISLDPKKANFYTSLADLYRLLYAAKKDLVIPTIESGLKQLPDDANLLLYLGSFYRDDAKDNAKAIFYYEKVLSLDPSNSGLKQEIDRLKSIK